MTFAEYVSEINDLARRCDAIPDGEENYCDPEAWRDAYQDGMTPAEAWGEEVSAAAH